MCEGLVYIYIWVWLISYHGPKKIISVCFGVELPFSPCLDYNDSRSDKSLGVIIIIHDSLE